MRSNALIYPKVRALGMLIITTLLMLDNLRERRIVWAFQKTKRKTYQQMW